MEDAVKELLMEIGWALLLLCSIVAMGAVVLR
jgi:hypothetical protein